MSLVISGSLINFLNVKQWTPENLLQYAKDHGETETLFGDKHGHDAWVKSRSFPGQFFVLDARHTGARYVLPGESDYQVFLDYLGGQLRSEWIDRIREYQEAGKLSSDYMDHLRSTLTVTFFNDFSVYAYCNSCQIEAWLERDFFNIIAFGSGDIYKKLKCCINTDCQKWFFASVPKNKYCSNKCKDSYWNRHKIKSGYLKEYQQKKRDEGHKSYFR